MRRSPILALAVLAVACGQGDPTGRSAVEELAALPADGRPPAVLAEGGSASYRLPDGRRVLFLTASGEVDEGGLVRSSTTASGRLLSDTWAFQSGGSFNDFGKSCELRVSHTSVPNPRRALLKFGLPSTLPCGSIMSATLSLTTAQLPASGFLTVMARKVTNPWMAGMTGAAGCSRCAVSSGTPAPFAMPNSVPAHSAPVTQPCQTHSWPVTAMVVDWCSAPITNHGVLLEGVSPFTAPEVNFHSMEAPGNGPVLMIVY
jgi:hypothetical protein